MSGNCPNCGKQTNSSDCRLIKDSCGHEKCRLCLLYEEEGCKTCCHLQKIELTASSGADEQEPLVASSPTGHSPEPPLKPKPPSPKRHEPAHRADPSAKKPSKPPDRNHIVTLPGQPERYKCTICLKIFRNKKGMCYHDVCRTGISPYHCTICNKTFVKKSHFEYHERVHSGYKPFSCGVCSKAFPQRNKLNRHMLSHDPDKKYLCSVCGKRYNKKDDLTAHSTIHSGAKPHVCPTCGKTFRLRTSLNRHLRSHSSERPFTCDTCNKSFKDKSLLARHKRTHGKDRPYSCAHCPRVFLSKSELRRHLSSHSDLKPFSCQLCQTVFRRKDNLIRHVRHHHLSNPGECVSSSPGVQERKNVEGKRKVGEKSVSLKRASGGQSRVRRGSKPGGENCQVSSKDSTTQITSRMDARGIITPVIRAPGESSNAVPVINGPISIRKPWEQPKTTETVLTFTQPIPIAEAVVINQRIEEKLYLQNSGSSSACFYRERTSREAHVPLAVLPPLGQNSAVRAVPGSFGAGRRMSGDSSFSPPRSGTLTELKSAALVVGDKEGLVEGRKKCMIVADERVNIQLVASKSEGTNCVSTIKKNFGFDAAKKANETHWRRRTAENLKPHDN